jgi:hypothetical protein
VQNSVIRQYDLQEYDFIGAVRDMLGVSDLPMLHTVYSADPAVKHDQNSTAHTRFYDAFEILRPLYLRFVREQILPLFKQDLCVQAIPTARFSFPGGTAVKEFHRDADYNHQEGTVNFWLPLTKAFDSNGLWLESAPGAADYEPINLEPGQYLEFDAIHLGHGNMPNETGLTRVSFDFRVIPRRQYRSTGLATVTSGMSMELGSYYTLAEWPGDD